MSKNSVAWVIKQGGGAIKVTFTSGWPWVREIANGRILTDGCSGNDYGWLSLDPTDQVISLHQGGTFTPSGRILGEVKIGRD